MHGRGCEVQRECGTPLAGTARMHSPPVQSDGRPDTEINVGCKPQFRTAPVG